MIHRGFLSIAALVVVLTIVDAKAFGAPPVEPKGYSIAEINVTDAEAYKQYVAAVCPSWPILKGNILFVPGLLFRSKGRHRPAASS